MDDTAINIDDFSESQIKLIKKINAVDKEAANRLASLIQDENADKLKDLSALQLANYLSPESIESSAFAKYGKWPVLLSLAEWIRNVIVLVPITWTWLSLSKASESYSYLLSLDNQYVKYPFLLLWERGFYGHGSGGMTFSQLAMFDFALLALVVFITLFVHLWRDLVEVGAGKRALKLRQELENYFGGLEEKLARARAKSSKVSQASENLTQAVEIFHTQSKEALNLIKQHLERIDNIYLIEKEKFAGMDTFVNRFQNGVLELRDLVQAIRPVYAQINQTLTNFLDLFHSTQKEQASINNSLISISKKFEESSRLYQEAEIQNKNILGEISSITSNNTSDRQIINNTLQRLTEFIDRFVESETALSGVVNRMAELVQRTPAFLKESYENITNLNDVIQKLDNTIKALSKNAGQKETGKPFLNVLVLVFLVGNCLLSVALIVILYLRLM